jgi:NAD(P)-dependent dehydrogenase (short-subunit alcohol dehydrogenase family)
MKIEGSVALVTGANRGLGQALVSELLQAGAKKVYATARDKSKITGGDDPRVVVLALDTHKPAELVEVAKQANDVTLLINNAGVLGGYDILDTPLEVLEGDFRTNFFGTLAMVKAFLPVLERANGAAIVNILTVASLASLPLIGGYSASKAAAYSLTQSLRPKLKPKKIEVLAALPGLIDTEMVRAFPMAKTSAADVARGILAGIARGDEEIFPDPMAKQFEAVWRQSAKALEQAFSTMGG